MLRQLLAVIAGFLVAQVAVGEPLALVPDALIDGISDTLQRDQAVIVEGERIVAVVPPATCRST